jgi:hypothetical protein
MVSIAKNVEIMTGFGRFLGDKAGYFSSFFDKVTQVRAHVR